MLFAKIVCATMLLGIIVYLGYTIRFLARKQMVPRDIYTGAISFRGSETLRKDNKKWLMWSCPAIGAVLLVAMCYPHVFTN